MPIDDVLRANLTDDQRNAATDPSREVLALACAGSGKSRTLAFRIARLLYEGVEPRQIVAFTFTDKAADSIKLRVAQALAAAGLAPTLVGAIYIGTIHSYCQNVLGQMDAKYRQFDVLDDNRLVLYIISRYPSVGMNTLRQRGGQETRYFQRIRAVSDAWKIMNDELLSLDAIEQRDQPLGAVLRNLDTFMRRDQYIDFSLMIRLVVDALAANSPAALAATSNLRHLIVDEYQDVNPSQEALIRALHSRVQTLFVVGDDDQAIYAWRGADVSNILTFQQRYANCASHTLPKNFRSTPAIVDTAEAFAAAELGAVRLPKNPQADPPLAPRDFRTLWFQTRNDEANWIADRIAALLGTAYQEKNGTVRGLTLGDFAILMRSTRQAEQSGVARHVPFTDAISARGMSYSLEAGGGVFDRPQVRVLQGAFELLRGSSPARPEAQQFFDNNVRPAYPSANFNRFAQILSVWGRKIHPAANVRQRLFPQQLVHDLLESFDIAHANFDAGVMQDIGVFSRILQDVESVYLSVDSTWRFTEVLNFLGNVAESGYDSGTEDVLRRPDVITVATVHKMKGLEFPVVFIVDCEAQRFPKRRARYDGWLPNDLMAAALARGAYQSTADEEARLFYTAMTRAERYLHISGSEHLPGGARRSKVSGYTARLVNPEISDNANTLPAGLQQAQPMRRVDETVVPTSFSEIRYYLNCPKNYQFRKSFGFSPPIPELFGFGKTVHTSVEKLHELFPDRTPTPAEAENVVEETFHLKHVAQSRDPQNHPGPYERAKDKAKEIVQEYIQDYGEDFVQSREVEVLFEIPVRHAVIAGAIDLLLKVDENNHIIEATVVDFKAIAGGDDPEANPDLEWTELSLQVQLYAKAAREVLSEEAKTGAVHLLKDNQRIEVPVTDAAIQAAVENVEWSVEQIIAGDFPMRPHPDKCSECDFKSLCPQRPRQFGTQTQPPSIQTPAGAVMPLAFSQFDPNHVASGGQQIPRP